MACSLEAVSIGKLENLLQCSICFGTVKDPRTLPCFHSYCKACLERFVKNHRENEVGRQDFNCPNCRRQFTLNPGEEVADMTPNHFIFNMLEVMAVQDRVKGVPCSHCQKSSVGRCVDCEVFLCQECLTDHNKYRGFVNHSILSMDELAKPENQRKIRRKLHCQEHRKTLKFYCETCEKLICRDCTDFNHEKPEHSWLPVEKVAEKQKQLLDESCTALENKLKQSNQALRKVTDVTQSLAKVKERVKLDINSRRDTILKAVTKQLNEKAQDLINQVDGIYSRKHDSLAKQKEEFQAYVKKLESCVDLSKEMLTKGTDEEILSSAKMMKEKIEKVQEIPKTMEPNGDDKICYEYGRMNIMTVGKVCAEMGKVEDRDQTIQRKIDKTLRTSYDDSLNVVEKVLKREKRTFKIDSLKLERHSARMRMTKYNLSRSDVKEQEKDLDQPFDKVGTIALKNEHKFRLEIFVMRFIFMHHWNEYEKLKTVCKVMFFKEGNAEMLEVLPADNVDKETFQRTVDDFVAFYRKIYSSTYQEELPTNKPSAESAQLHEISSEACKRFSVILSRRDNGKTLVIFGQRETVLQAVEFIKSKLGH